MLFGAVSSKPHILSRKQRGYHCAVTGSIDFLWEVGKFCLMAPLWSGPIPLVISWGEPFLSEVWGGRKFHCLFELSLSLHSAPVTSFWSHHLMRWSHQMLLKIFSSLILVLFFLKIIILHAQFYIRKKENWTCAFYYYLNQYIRLVNNSHAIWIYSILTMECCFWGYDL